MKDLIKFINKNIMDDSSSDIGDSSTEDITFKRIENGFEITAPTGKKFKLINKLPETTNEQPKYCNCTQDRCLDNMNKTNIGLICINTGKKVKKG